MAEIQTKWTFSRLMWLYQLSPREARKTHADKHAWLLRVLQKYADAVGPNGRSDWITAQMAEMARTKAEDEFKDAVTVLALIENSEFCLRLRVLANQWAQRRMSQTHLRDDRFEEFLDRAEPDLYPELRSAWLELHSVMDPILANPTPTTTLTL